MASDSRYFSQNAKFVCNTNYVISKTAQCNDNGIVRKLASDRRADCYWAQRTAMPKPANLVGVTGSRNSKAGTAAAIAQ